MPVVSNTIELPDGVVPDSIRVEIVLVTSAGVPTAGWIAADDVAVLSVARFAASAGSWSVSLHANSGISPAGTRYRVTEFVGGRRYTHTIEVGDGGGSLHDLLVA